jgi:hypothetical protein
MGTAHSTNENFSRGNLTEDGFWGDFRRDAKMRSFPHLKTDLQK